MSLSIRMSIWFEVVEKKIKIIESWKEIEKMENMSKIESRVLCLYLINKDENLIKKKKRLQFNEILTFLEFWLQP